MTEDVQGIPDVQGLEDFVASEIQDKSPDPVVQQPEVKEPEQQTPTEEQFDLAQFKTPKDLLKGYKEVQGAFTRTTQENKALKEQMQQMEQAVQEQMELMRLSQMRPQPQAPPVEDFDQQFIADPRKAVETLAERKAQALLMQSKVQDVLEEENLKNPNEFGERYQYAKMVAQQYPQLATSTAGVKKLFQMGDKFREEQQKRQAYNLVAKVFGDDVDMEKFKKLIQKDTGQITQTNNAYMPDSISGRNKSEPAPFNAEMEISEGIKKGDPDAVLSALFRQKGLK